MTEHETDGMDDYGRRLGPELHGLSERAIQPFDAVSVAYQVAVAHPRASRPFPFGRAWPLARPGPVLTVVLATAVLLAALAGFALLAGGDVPRPAPVTGRIVFAHAVYDPTRRERPRDLAFFSVSSDGGSPTRLVDVPESVPSPARRSLAGCVRPCPSGLVGPAARWSPDASRIAFRLFNEEAGIWLMNRDGSDLHRLVDLPLDHGPRTPFLEAIDWAPDGTRIAYTYPYDGPHSPIYVVDVEDGGVTNLTGPDPARGATRVLAWSPDGTRIAFARTEGAGGHSGSRDGLFVMNADGTGEVRLDDAAGGTVRGLTWAPDGKRIAFIRVSYEAGPITTLMVIDANGQGLREIKQLWQGGGCCFFESTDLRPLAWLPGTDQIAIVFDIGLDQPEGELETIWLLAADGSGMRELTEGSFFDLSPDGSRLVVAEARLDQDPGPYSIYVMNVDGTDKRWVVDGEFPAWAPLPRQ
jgi:Tol biopolymer transport system component